MTQVVGEVKQYVLGKCPKYKVQPSQTRPDQTRPDQTRIQSRGPNSRTCVLVVCCGSYVSVAMSCIDHVVVILKKEQVMWRCCNYMDEWKSEKASWVKIDQSLNLKFWKAITGWAHRCTILFCYLGCEVDFQHRDTNMNYKDHLVWKLTITGLASLMETWRLVLVLVSRCRPCHLPLCPPHALLMRVGPWGHLRWHIADLGRINT